MILKRKKLTVLLTLAAMACGPFVHAENYYPDGACCPTDPCVDPCGSAYVDCCDSGSMAPKVAFGVVAIAATAAIIVSQNGSNCGKRSQISH